MGIGFLSLLTFCYNPTYVYHAFFPSLLESHATFYAAYFIDELIYNNTY